LVTTTTAAAAATTIVLVVARAIFMRRNPGAAMDGNVKVFIVARVVFKRWKPKKGCYCAATRTQSTTVSSSSRALWMFEALVGAAFPVTVAGGQKKRGMLRRG